ncbi:MAG: putative ABC transport system permease protein [Polaribacter sp.]|jgi:putative ABC transport system permease protein
MLEIRPILSALTRHKSSTFLMILQIAITFAVVINSISIIKQRLDLMNRDTGLAESEMIAFNINPFGENYDLEHNFKADIELLRNTPGVIDALVTNMVPISGSGSSSTVSATEDDANNDEDRGAGFFRGDSHILNTFGLKLASGRNFKPNEIVYSQTFVEPKVVMITQSLADKLYPKNDALGNQIYFWGTSATIVGIIEKLAGPWPSTTQFMDNLIQPIISLSNFNRIIVRIEKSQVSEMLVSVEKTLLARNANRVISNVRSLDEIKRRSYSDDYAMTKILWSVVILLISITLLGIIGIVSFNVNQRIKQIGTRRALGARKIDIQRYFITENILITSMGLVVGTLIAIVFSLYLAQTFSTPQIDWYYYPLGTLVMLLVGISAVWVPAQRASNVSPAVATQSI